MMLRRLAFVSGLAVLSAVALAPKAGAAPATQDINFGGNIGSVCTFTSPVDGTLAQGNPTDGWIEGSNGIGGGTGTAGSVTLNCSAGGSLSVAGPVKVAAPTTFAPSVTEALVVNNTNGDKTRSPGTAFDSGMWNVPTASLTIPAAANQSLKVGMVTGIPGSTTSVPPGTYTYKVTLTATPN